MKAGVALAVLFGCALSALGQGSINFNNRATSGGPALVVAPIFGVDINDNRPKQGNPATYVVSPVPVGTQTYYGSPLVGTGFTAALWGVNVNVPDSVLADINTPPIAAVPFRATTNPNLMGFWQPPGVAPVVPGVIGGTTDRAKFIVRAWDNKGGTISTWAQVLQDGSIPRGESTIFTVNALLGVSPSIPPPNLVGLESFQLYTTPGGPATPEPSAIVLALLGVAGCVLFGHRKFGQRS